MATRKTIDWDRVEAEYGANIKSLREIATDHGITEGAIRKRAKRDDWQRDLSAKIRAKADSLVRKALVRTEVRNPAENALVAGMAELQAGVRVRHQGTISRAQAHADMLLAELEAVTKNHDLFEAVGELLFSPDKTGRDRLNELYAKVIELPGRIKGAKDLADTLATLVRLEREAYGMAIAADEAPPAPPAGTDDPSAVYRWFASLRPGAVKLDGVPLAAEVVTKR